MRRSGGGLTLPPGVAEGLAALGRRYDVSPERLTRLARLLEGLAAEPHPPTTVRAPVDALDGHLADSLAGLTVPALARADRIADVGAGAGFPGLALAAELPTARVDLIEAAGRKCAVI